MPFFIGSNVHIANNVGSFSASPAPDLDDFIYALRLESENARRNVPVPEGGITLDGDRGCVFDGTAKWVQTLASSSFDLGTAGNGDFTIEFYVNFSTLGFYGLISTFDGVDGGYQIYYNNTLNVLEVWTGTGTARNVSWTPTTATWYHIAIVRVGSTITAYINGSSAGTLADGDFSSDGGSLGFGSLQGASGIATPVGKMSRVQIATTALYTSNFTPPARTSDITITSDSMIACDFVGVNGSTRILDSARPAYGVESPAVAPIVPDESGNEKDAVAPTASNRPLYDPVNEDLAFNGLAHYLAGTLVLPQTYTVYTVADISPAAAAQIFFGDANARVELTADEYLSGNAGTALTYSTDVSGSKKILAVEFSAGTSKIYVDGTLQATGNTGLGALAAYGIGARNDGSSFTLMDWFATFVTSTAYQSGLNQAISSKYGI